VCWDLVLGVGLLGLVRGVASALGFWGMGHRLEIKVNISWEVLNIGARLEAWGIRTACEWDARHAAFGSCKMRVQIIMRRGKALLVGHVSLCQL